MKSHCKLELTDQVNSIQQLLSVVERPLVMRYISESIPQGGPIAASAPQLVL